MGEQIEQMGGQIENYQKVGFFLLNRSKNIYFLSWCQKWQVKLVFTFLFLFTSNLRSCKTSTPVKCMSALIWRASLIPPRYWLFPFDWLLRFLTISICSETSIVLSRKTWAKRAKCLLPQTRNWRNLNMPWRRKISSFQSRKKLVFSKTLF